MKDDAMKEALQRRKGQGIDLTIIIGDGKPKEDKENGELAPTIEDAGKSPVQDTINTDQNGSLLPADQSLKGPPLTPPGSPENSDEDADKALITKMLNEHELAEGDEPATSIGARARNLMKSKFKQ